MLHIDSSVGIAYNINVIMYIIMLKELNVYAVDPSGI